MMRLEYDDAPPCYCTPCAACRLGLRSCCRPVACKTNGKHHGCACEANGHDICGAAS